VCLHIRYDNYLCRFMEFTLVLWPMIFFGAQLIVLKKKSHTSILE
jgi:hypothetical protein